jgi:hypothetical protein
MVNLFTHEVTIGGRSYNKGKSGYPALPTVFSGVEVTWGAPSCIEHPEPSRAVISLWVPKTHESFIPTLGEVVSVKAGVVEPWGAGNGQYAASVFAGKVESVKIKDDHKPNGGYRINVVAADALAEAARLRLSDSPWPFETAASRQTRIAELASKNGVVFQPGNTIEQGFTEAVYTDVRPRDVDSFPALEAFQRTTMAAGHTVISSGNVVQPSVKLKLPQVLSADTSASTTKYAFDASGAGRHTMTVNGVLTRTNWASNASGDDSTLGYFAIAGTGGTATLGNYFVQKHGRFAVGAEWTASATGGYQSFGYQQASVTGASASRVSAGIWVRSTVAKSVKMNLILLSGPTPTQVGTKQSAIVSLAKDTWTWIKVDGATATAAYDRIDVRIEPQSNMLAGERLHIDGVLIEKTATAGTYFDRYTLDSLANIVPTETSSLVHIDSSAIVDDVFELDTTKVVNEIKIDMTRFIGSVGEPGWEQKDSANPEFDQIFTDEVGTRKTTPQTRSIVTDWAIRDAYLDDLLPNSVMVTKGKLLLSGQSKAQWRLSQAMSLVLRELPAQESINNLIHEVSRFGSLIAIDNGPALLPKYMRVRGGRIVLGEETQIELELEPVEYSAPVPLTKNSLNGDPIASYFKIQNFKTLSANDLRTIGAR